jgi:formate hydrogenlyase subunit 3/multisubunit Na+/H+ antiporter MnhD subunit/formate hydrogenlyase subunit 4
MSLALILVCVALLLAIGAGAVVWRREATPLVYGASLALSSLVLIVAVAHLVSWGGAATIVLPLGLPWIGAHFRLDALAAFFLAVVNLGGAAASAYGLGYGPHEAAPGRVLPFFPAFLAGMNLVVVAADAFAFLLAWEFMSLSSWALVMAHHRERDNAHAGYVYLVMASFGMLSLLLAFGLLAGPSGGYAFAAIRAADLPPGLSALVLALVLLGAGSKAGLVPLHVWLPLAHPAAPSHVSALMSGVMTKVAVYGFVRIVFDLLGPPAWWWSVVVLVLGGTTAVLGVLYALMQHDLKRLLAYHTVENIGIIFIGLGLALAFQANAMGLAAALALTAALFHVFNHSVFKSLLFFGSGAVLVATGERDMEHLGGLIHRMPLTAFTFLVGAAAISALPPLNGFVSEWLTFQAILVSPEVPQWSLKFLIPAIGAALALSAALAAACFVKAFGVSFLGRARSEAAARAQEVDRISLGTMFAFAGLCVFAGVFPGLIIDGLAPIVMALTDGARLPVQTTIAWLTVVPVSAARSSYNGLLVLLFVVLSASAAAYVIHRFASHAVRRALGLGLRLSRSEPYHPVQRRQLRAADSPGLRHACLSGARAGRHATARRPPPGTVAPAHAGPGLGGHLRAGRGRGRLRRRPAEPPSVPDHPPLFDPGLPGPGLPFAGARDMALIQGLLVQGAQMALVLILAPLLTGFVRKVKSRLLRRQGPSLVQPYRDLLRLLRKEVVLAESASWLFRAAPYMIFAATWVAAALVPTFAAGILFSWSADLIAIIALLASARFFLALAGLDVGTSFGGIGSSREVMIASLAEPAMIMIVFTLALLAGTTQLSSIAGFMLDTNVGLRVSLGLALVALIMVAIAENARIPVDNPATHLELTMVHEAMVLEYSGRHLAMIELAASLKLLLYVSLLACVFLPWGMAASGAGMRAYAAGIGAYAAKLALGGALLALFETSIAKMRVFRVPQFLGAALMLGLLATLLLFVTRSL